MALLPYYNEIGIDIYESLTGPPYGDTVLAGAIKMLDKNITLLGNYDQIKTLVEGTPEQIEREARELAEIAAKRGNFIIGMTDYLRENTPHENIRAFYRGASSVKI